jgi:YVTN family beta-propeller protein
MGRRYLPLILAAALLCVPAKAAAEGLEGAPGTDEVVFVGSNWSGTVSMLDPANDYEEIGRVNMIPDEEERMLEIALNPVDLAFFIAIQQLIGEGHNQYVDDMYTTPDGSLLIASRPSFKDVIALDIDDCTNLDACDIAWRFEVAGQRSDHMGISPDGRRVAVSASTGNVVHILNARTGKEVDQFGSGDSPHENTYSENGKRLYHASIGRVYTPNPDTGNPEIDSTKGVRVFRVVETDDYEIVEDVDIRQELNDAGYEELSAAVRPMAISRNENRVYLQLSFFHGFMVYSFKKDKFVRKVDLPNQAEEPESLYLLNSAHHGIALNGRGNKLCVAGTMSDYAAIVNRRSIRRPDGPKFKLLHKGLKPYWSTTSADGRSCYVSWSGSDTISVIDYAKRKETHNIPVGDHPQRIRTGYLPSDWVDAQTD